MQNMDDTSITKTFSDLPQSDVKAAESAVNCSLMNEKLPGLSAFSTAYDQYCWMGNLY